MLEKRTAGFYRGAIVEAPEGGDDPDILRSSLAQFGTVTIPPTTFGVTHLSERRLKFNLQAQSSRSGRRAHR